MNNSSGNLDMLVKLGILNPKESQPNPTKEVCTICGNDFSPLDLRTVTNGTIAERHCINCSLRHSEK